MPPSPRPAPLFGDRTVLQRDKPVPIWGTAGPGEEISVHFRGQSAHAVAGPDGRWMVALEPMGACAEPADIEVAGSGKTLVRDVVVGDVWLASGQSNMEFAVKGVRGAAREMAESEFRLIRHLRVAQAVSTAPVRDFATRGWEAATPGSVGEFTAVGYFFARDIHRKLGVPVGIIHSSWGGTPVESWMSGSARASTSLAALLEARWKQAMADWPPERAARYLLDMAAWQEAEEKAKATRTLNPLAWPQPPASNDSPALPGGLFNAMISPLQPCGLRGILWYQGESNVGRHAEYAELFPAMIRSWREGWGQGDLPFYFVQIANYLEQQDPTNRCWARLREAQEAALRLPATGMAVSIDVGQADDIHPVNKQEVGHRLALAALAGTYGLPMEFRGPEFAGHLREGAALRVRFSNAGTGLTARGDRVQELEVAGSDRVFYPATATMDGDSLVVSSPSVGDPVAVRYAWVNAPDANLYNSAGLPAAPFRSDDW